MNRITIFLATLLTSTGLVAHHATTVAYDTENLGTIEGEVVSVFWRNPHIVVTIERVSASGVRETWDAEAGSVNSLQRIGIGRDIVSIGDRVTLMGALSREGLPAMAAYTMTLPDGNEIALWPQRANEIGRGAPSAPFSSDAVAAGEREADGIFRVWSRTGGPLRGELPLSEAALAARASWDPLTDDPALRCEPPGMPTMMNNPYPIQFIDEGETITLRLEEWDGLRTIDMRAGATADDKPTSPTGYSIGQWEGSTLVISTTRISDPYFDDLGTPQSAESELLERFTLSDDETRLDYTLTITDPVTFTSPVTLTGFWEWVAGEQLKEFNCALPEAG
jgi:hypothetical protein